MKLKEQTIIKLIYHLALPRVMGGISGFLAINEMNGEQFNVLAKPFCLAHLCICKLAVNSYRKKQTHRFIN
jgi:hypothetical protein